MSLRDKDKDTDYFPPLARGETKNSHFIVFYFISDLCNHHCCHMLDFSILKSNVGAILPPSG